MVLSPGKYCILDCFLNVTYCNNINNTTMYHLQRTLAKPAACSGIGVHSGKNVTIVIKPAPANHGIRFVRTDLPDHPEIPALFSMVVDTSLATVIGRDGVIVQTIEHIMAAFAGFSIENAIVEINSYEMPIMDGSAAPFTELIKKTGINELAAPRHFFIIKKPIEVKHNDKSVAVYPSSRVKMSCSIDFSHPLIKTQSFSSELTDDIFEKEISRARTFGFKHEYEYMKSVGLARGGDLGNAVVIDNNRILNEDGLRYDDEFVRHKALDCIGDFSLLGMPILGHIVTHKSGHAFNHAFLQKFFSQKDSWATGCVKDIEDSALISSKSLAI